MYVLCAFEKSWLDFVVCFDIRFCLNHGLFTLWDRVLSPHAHMVCLRFKALSHEMRHCALLALTCLDGYRDPLTRPGGRFIKHGGYDPQNLGAITRIIRDW